MLEFLLLVERKFYPQMVGNNEKNDYLALDEQASYDLTIRIRISHTYMSVFRKIILSRTAKQKLPLTCIRWGCSDIKQIKPRHSMTTVPSMLDGTFHRRELREPAISFSSSKGKQLFRECLNDDMLEGYYILAENYVTQAHPAFCGISSLTMALNALLLDPQRVWQGVWRWFDESMLDCCQPLDATRLYGITLDKMYCLARCKGADTTLKYASDITIEEFREDLLQISTQLIDGAKESVVMIASYSRKPLNQTGTGHFSPIGAYNREHDMLLVMDVARFKYPPHWIPVPLFFSAMQDIDVDTGKSRGYMILKSSSELQSTCENCCEHYGIDGTMKASSKFDTFEASAGEVKQFEQSVMEVQNLIVSTSVANEDSTPKKCAHCNSVL
jgi:hypothetical protein